MAINVVYNPSPTTLLSALTGLAAHEQAQKDRLQNAQAAILEQRPGLLEREFAYQQERDAAQRAHGLETLDRQYDRLEQRDQQQFERLPQELDLQNDSRLDLEERQFTTRQKRELSVLDNAELALASDPTFDQAERAQAMEMIARQRMAVRTAGAISAKSPFKPGEGIGDVWEFGGKGSGMWVTRNEKGTPTLLHRADQSGVKLADYTKMYDQVEAGLATEDGSLPDPAVIEARVEARMRSFLSFQQKMKDPDSFLAPPPSPGVGPREGPGVGAPSPTPSRSPSTPLRASITEKGLSQAAPFIPPDHALWDLPEGAQFEATNLNGKPGTITAAELAAAALRFRRPVDEIAQLLGITKPPTPPTTPTAADENEDLASHADSLIGGYR